jgi:hypothetical protein
MGVPREMDVRHPLVEVGSRARSRDFSSKGMIVHLLGTVTCEKVKLIRWYYWSYISLSVVPHKRTRYE